MKTTEGWKPSLSCTGEDRDPPHHIREQAPAARATGSSPGCVNSEMFGDQFLTVHHRRVQGQGDASKHLV